MKRLLLFLCVAAGLLQACTPGGNLNPQIPYDNGSGVEHEMLVLGSRLEDPYTVANMTKALASLYPTKADIVPLQATDYYMRFLPRTEEDIKLLESMGVQMLDHPLDYQIVREGDYYHDPEIEDGEITWQYAVVPVGFEAPDEIMCELIDECFLADNRDKTKAALEDIDWDAVEREAYRLTGNEAMILETRADDEPQYPKGRITVIDEDYDSEPVGLAGVKVSCNVFVKFARCYTDDEGYYEMTKSFTSEPRYRIEFTNIKGFSIGINAILVKGSVSTLGKQPAAGYNLCITPDSDAKLFRRAAVNNAAFEYYEKCSAFGSKIPTPPSNLRIWIMPLLDSSAAVMMQQGAIVDMDFINDLLGSYAFVVKLFLPDVVIGMEGKRKYSDYYHSTVHELAHASHFMQVGTDYWDNFISHIVMSYVTSGRVVYGTGTEELAGYCEVGEMWAYYMETLLYRERYGQWNKKFGTSFWFRPEIFLYLDERGLNRFMIFAALTTDVSTREILKARLLNMYTSFKSNINEAFNNYL